MKCKHCGKKIKDEAFCPRCGEFVSTEDGQVSLAGINATAKKKKKLTKKQIWLRVGLIALAVVAALAIVVGSVAMSLLGRVNKESEISGEMHINPVLPTNDVQNIALLGTDSRQDNDSGRADAIIILSIDRKRGMIKMTSIARDTYVEIPGRGHDKLNHAYAYGKAPLIVKTLNKNFDMNITDYVYVNFFEFVELIDYIGGVDLDINASEMRVMNETYTWHLRALGMDCPNITQTGMQHVNGAQALAYSRNRYTDGDTGRGNRHREVLEAMFVAVKDLPLTKFPSLIGKVLEMCHTTLTDGELMGLATWALTANPGFGSQSLPTPECNPRSGANAMINGVWYYIYDLDIATDIMHKFIYEDDVKHFPTGTRTMPNITTGALATTDTTDPSATTDPSGTSDPTGITDPSDVSDPNESDPNVSDPNESDPNESNPDVSDPNMSDPNESDPNVSDPNESDPNESDPDASDPNESDPNVSSPNESDVAPVNYRR